MIDSIQDGVMIMEHGKVVYVNDSACEIFGYSREELNGLGTLDLADPEERERLREIMERSWEQGIPTRELEFWIVRKDGSRRCAHNRYSVNLKGNDIVGRYVFVTDITGRRSIEDSLRKENSELRSENRKLKENDRRKDEFISILAHDSSTPLVVMQGNLEMMQMWPQDKLLEQLPEKLDLLLRNTKRLDRLRKDYLDLANIDLGIMKLEKEAVNLKELALEAVEDLKMLVEERDQQVSVDPIEYDTVYCDRERVRQVFDNYLSNAINYTPEGGKIEIGSRVDDGEVTVWVKDNGRGIAIDEVEKVFKRFYRAGERMAGSTGLGLSIVKGIVEAHGGRAWCESEGVGKGTTFFFTMPLPENDGD